MLELIGSVMTSESVGTAITFLLILILYEMVKTGREYLTKSSHSNIANSTSGGSGGNGWKDKYEEAQWSRLKETLELGFTQIVNELREQQKSNRATFDALVEGRERAADRIVDEVRKLRHLRGGT